MMNWGRLVRTEGFRSLSRTSLMELCEVVDMEGRVVGGDELDDTTFAASRSAARRRSELESEGDDLDDDGEGMDIA